MVYKFLASDFGRLTEEIESLSRRIKEIGIDMGKSCLEGAETFHDNFTHEQGERDQQMWSGRRRQLLHFKNHAQVVQPPSTPTVSLGKRVTLQNEGTQEKQTVVIGSFITFKDDHVSYAAPLARLIIGAQKGEKRSGEIAGEKITFLILEIEQNLE